MKNKTISFHKRDSNKWKYILIIVLSLYSLFCFGQIRIYKGFIDKYPIQLTIKSYSDGDTRAIYSYDKYDTPIVVNGHLKNDTLILLERDRNGDSIAKLIFSDVDFKSNTLEGVWISQAKQSRLNIRLNKYLEFENFDEVDFKRIELMQPASTENNYFKLLLTKEIKEDARVQGVRIYEKRTDKLIQEIQLDCQLMGLDNISVGDYNFDGLMDFSVFEQSYAGPNTSSIYILRIPDSENYFVSEITGTSLGFDYESKLVYEHNQCCAGRNHMNAIYKIVDNKMVLIERKCVEYSDEEEDFIEINCN